MDRKKTIIIAVMINAGLLVVLFIAAMTMKEESREGIRSIDSSGLKPLFSDRIEIPSVLPVETASVEIPFASEERKTEEPIVHTLPPRAIDSPAPANLPMAAVINPTPLSAPLAPPSIEVLVQKGDSLEKIAKNHKTTVDEIIRLNQLPSSFLRAGQRLKIPAEKTLPAASVKTKPVPSAQMSGSMEYYTMKVGDNPWSIAMKHHMKIDELLKLNGLNEEKARKLKPGDRLRIR